MYKESHQGDPETINSRVGAMHTNSTEIETIQNISIANIKLNTPFITLPPLLHI